MQSILSIPPVSDVSSSRVSPAVRGAPWLAVTSTDDGSTPTQSCIPPSITPRVSSTGWSTTVDHHMCVHMHTTPHHMAQYMHALSLFLTHTQLTHTHTYTHTCTRTWPNSHKIVNVLRQPSSFCLLGMVTSIHFKLKDDLTRQAAAEVAATFYIYVVRLAISHCVPMIPLFHIYVSTYFSFG